LSSFLLGSTSTYTIELLKIQNVVAYLPAREDLTTTCFERYKEYYCRMLLSLQGINGALNASAEEKYTNLTVS
jgi:hypothetical protein